MTISLEHDNGVARLRLDQPATLNALTPDDFEQLAVSLEEVGTTDGDRVLVITGTGKAFCSGADLSQIRRDVHPLPLMNRIHRAAKLLHHLEKPTIAAVNGVAAGAGANLALGCDLVIAGQSARFIEAFVKRGLAPDFGGSWLLPRLVGPQRANRILLLGEPLPAQAAYDIGLIAEVVADDELAERVETVARQLVAGPPLALAQTKQLIGRSMTSSLDDQLDAEAVTAAVVSATDDCAEGFAAFLERRQPVFNGR